MYFKIILSIFVIGLFIFIYFIGKSPNPCKNITCNGHGNCSNGTCICTDGWTGTNCTTSPSSNPCQGIDCGTHGNCISGECKCNIGWSGPECTEQTKKSCVYTDCNITAKKVIYEWSKLFNNEPFVMLVNCSKESIVAVFGANSGLVPCNVKYKDTCLWNNNPGLSCVKSLTDKPSKTDLNTGIIKKWEILQPSEYWLIKIPLDSKNKPQFCYKTASGDTGKVTKSDPITCAGLNFWFGNKLTGKYQNKNLTQKWDTLDEAIKANGNNINLVYPEAVSLSSQIGMLNVKSAPQIELGINGIKTYVDITGVDGISSDMGFSFVESKTGADMKCNYMDGTKKSELGCSFDTSNCDFPLGIKTNGKWEIIANSDGKPYNCLSVGTACSTYKKDKSISEIWKGDLKTKFNFTDSQLTKWDLDGCVDGTKYCTGTGANQKYMNMTADAASSCDWLNGSVILDKTPWTTGGNVPPNIDKDLVWKKYDCGSNFGSTSARLRLCKYDPTDTTCPIASASCLANNGKTSLDSWNSNTIQDYCTQLHSSDCNAYCQSYDDKWGTLVCDISAENPSSIIISIC